MVPAFFLSACLQRSDMELDNEYQNYEDEDDESADDLPPSHHPRSFQSIIGWLYDKAVSGIAGIESAEMLAARYLEDAKG
ncbi:TPA: hypothetical protein LTW10_002128 [Salmonella enterica subsp. enterica serovar Rissen]|nr:hypothetical protein [Salmonella enterica subsp. enterica serovar Rissen]EHJ5256187.1 hypothetical protein [Salmonella enterica]EJZ8104754.1 hypothetical protein [Salmonella enterica subsp. enterica serovar Oranienburg]EKC7051608.1 hypothetical protein [Salmonella enterica subsp. enterica]MBJ5552199.1 hypothetical protein [Salmonella enterica subsp. enterica serovar Derby]QQL62478.1 hypothetical protein HIX61_21205 [Salmonella enterica subsp. enterica serovar Othmarschen]